MWLLVLAACGGGTEPREGVTGSGSSAPSALSGARAPLTEPTVAPVTGMHGAAIARIAVTDAGDAAVTADTTGAIRLWRFRSAIAKLDRATGALRQRQCGWGFGIADQPFEQGPDATLVCDVSP